MKYDSVLNPCFSAKIYEKPKSIKTNLSWAGLNIMLSGLISLWTILKLCMRDNSYFMDNALWYLSYEYFSPLSIATWIQSLNTIKSNPKYLSALGAQPRAEQILKMAHSFKILLKTVSKFWLPLSLYYKDLIIKFYFID